MTPLLRLNTIQVLALAGLAIAAGIWLKRRIPLLDRLHIPDSVLGGTMFALIAFVLRDRWLNLEFDTSLRDVLLIASFTTVGMNASLRVVKKGGLQVGLLALLAFVGGVFQGVVGILLATALHLNPAVGLLAGTVSLAGGPSTALAFGPVFEQMGVAGATTVALASATFGITIAGLVAGWTGGRLIRNRKPETTGRSDVTTRNSPVRTCSHASLLRHALLITIAMGLGSLISLGLNATGVVLPGFVGAMIAAVLIRNFDEQTGVLQIETGTVEAILSVVLPLFIAISMLTLKLWDLAAVALPLLVILLIQVVLTWAFSTLVAFRVMGGDYEAAVATSGFCGFMLGITPNAMASMEELATKYGSAPRAFLIVPLVGAFLIDLTNSLVITTFANFLRR